MSKTDDSPGIPTVTEHSCATCGLPDLGKDADAREGSVLCATCGLPLDDRDLAVA